MHSQSSADQSRVLHACIKKVTEDLEDLKFNTAISELMIFVNEAITWQMKPLVVMRDFLLLLQPFAPHLAEELWSKLPTGARGSMALPYVPWPRFDAKFLIEDTLEIPVQVNGKLRDVLKVPVGTSAAELEAAARASEKVQQFINGKTIKKVIVLPGRLVNLAVS